MQYAWWPHTTNRSTASYRLRCAQIVQSLRSQGMASAEWQPGMPAPQVLVLCKRYDPSSLETVLQLKAQHGTRLVLDLCDNHFYTTSERPMWQTRTENLRRAVQSVDMVIASTLALAAVIRAECPQAPRIEVIGDAAELPVFDIPHTLRGLLAVWRLNRLENRLQRLAPERVRRVVWFGNHGSGYADGGMSDLASVRTQLETAHGRWPLHLTVVSNSRRTFSQVTAGWKIPTTYIPWQAENFSRVLALHGTCIIPIRSNPFTSCKTNNRVATALLHGLSVVADSIPSYEEFSSYITLGNWEGGLENALRGSEKNICQCTDGANYVRTQFSLEKITQEWKMAMESLAAAPASVQAQAFS